MNITSEYVKRPWVLCALAMILGLAVYIQALGYGFVYDDFPLIVDNEHLRDFSSLPELLIQEDAIDGYSRGYYRPLASLADFLIYQAFGPSSFAFHLINILFHMGAVALVFILALRLNPDCQECLFNMGLIRKLKGGSQ